MAEIPAGSKFIMIDPSVPTRELKSARSNSKTEVYTIEDIAETLGGGSDYTETIVNISSAQILSMGTSPIELLPDPGLDKYYDIDKIVIEYTKGTTDYTTSPLAVFYGNFIKQIKNTLSGDLKQFAIIRDLYLTDLDIPNEYVTTRVGWEQTGAVELSTFDNVNPTLGDGTLRVKIYHKTLTFGA